MDVGSETRNFCKIENVSEAHGWVIGAHCYVKFCLREICVAFGGWGFIIMLWFNFMLMLSNGRFLGPRSLLVFYWRSTMYCAYNVYIHKYIESISLRGKRESEE